MTKVPIETSEKRLETQPLVHVLKPMAVKWVEPNRRKQWRPTACIWTGPRLWNCTMRTWTRCLVCDFTQVTLISLYLFLLLTAALQYCVFSTQSYESLTLLSSLWLCASSPSPACTASLSATTAPGENMFWHFDTTRFLTRFINSSTSLHQQTVADIDSQLDVVYCYPVSAMQCKTTLKSLVQLVPFPSSGSQRGPTCMRVQWPRASQRTL